MGSWIWSPWAAAAAAKATAKYTNLRIMMAMRKLYKEVLDKKLFHPHIITSRDLTRPIMAN